CFFFFSSRRRHTRFSRDWSSDVCSSDLFQEITIQLWKAYPRFRGDAKFTTWAYRVALNTAITLFRKKTKGINTIEIDSNIHRINIDEYNYEEEEQLRVMYRAIHQLGDIDKALVFIDRKSTRLNSSHVKNSYAVFCLKKRKKQ